MHFVDQQSDQPEVDLLFVDAADRHEAGLESEVIPVVREQLKNVAFHLRWCIDATACTPQIDNLHTSPFGPRALPAGAPPIMRSMVILAHAGFSAASVLRQARSEEHTSELQSLMRISYAVFCLKKKKTQYTQHTNI